jgi:hypothetical protein
MPDPTLEGGGMPGPTLEVQAAACGAFASLAWTLDPIDPRKTTRLTQSASGVSTRIEFLLAHGWLERSERVCD